MALAALCVLTVLGFSAAVSAGEAYTDYVILSTSDMHGKCWDKNLLTDASVTNNMLHVATAVEQIRQEYGEENCLLIDNGDLCQGTPVSQVQLYRGAEEYTEEDVLRADSPLAMSLCLTEIDYDAFILGNHEFNFPWETMERTYACLEENGVPVLAANVYYDGSDGVHEEGENVFGTYITRTGKVNGHDHRIGLWGFESCDIPRWDLPVNFPGMRFSCPGTPASIPWRWPQRVVFTM